VIDYTPLFGSGLEQPVPDQSREPLQPAREPAPERRREVWFNDVDAAYLVDAFVRQNLDASVAAGVMVVPTERGPGLEISGEAFDHRVVRALIRRFGGHAAGGGGGRSNRP
jgi:hypothetical protein